MKKSILIIALVFIKSICFSQINKTYDYDSLYNLLKGLKKEFYNNLEIKTLLNDIESILPKIKISNSPLKLARKEDLYTSLVLLEEKSNNNKNILNFKEDLISYIAKAEADILTKNLDIVAVFKGREAYLNTVNLILGTKIDNISIADGLKDDLITFKTEIDNTIIGIRNSVTPVPKSLEELSAQLQAKIDDCNIFTVKSYSKKYFFLDSTETAHYVQENIDEIKKLASGNYDLLFDQKGNLTTFKENNFKNLEPKDIKIITDLGINIPLPTKISFSVISNDSILVSTDYYSSTTKAVYFNNISKSYISKESPSSSKITITNDASINKKQLKIIYQYKKEKLVNGIVLESVAYTKEEVKDILKK